MSDQSYVQFMSNLCQTYVQTCVQPYDQTMFNLMFDLMLRLMSIMSTLRNRFYVPCVSHETLKLYFVIEGNHTVRMDEL
jgi:hypothetical protein